MDRSPGARLGPGPWVAALGAAAWVWILTSFHGAGLDNDAAEYLSAAESLLEGRGWLGVDGRPYTLWPPLYPALLAVVRTSGLEVSDAVRTVHCASVGAIALLVASIARRVGPGRIAASAASALSAAAVARIAPMAWSETVFTALAVLAAWCWLRYRESASLGRFLALSLALALAFAQRYVGALLIAAFSGALLFARDIGPPGRRVARAVSLALVAATPILAWIARNRFVAGRLDGRRGPPSGDLGKNVADAAFELFAFVPRDPGFRTALALVPLALLAIGAARIVTRERPRGAATLVLLPAVFASGLVVLRHVVEFDAIDARLMTPALPFVAIVGAAGAAALAELLAGRVRSLAVAAAAAWVAFLAFDIARGAERRLRSARENGVGLYDSPAWRRSPTAAWLREHPLEGEVSSNEAYALYVLTGARTGHLPPRPAGFRKLAEQWAAVPRPRAVVWFPFNERARFPSELFEGVLRAERTHELGDGEIWSLGG